MLLLDPHLFDCVALPCRPVDAPIDRCITPLPNFLHKLVVVKELVGGSIFEVDVLDRGGIRDV
jgi:hypothetical protein